MAISRIFAFSLLGSFFFLSSCVELAGFGTQAAGVCELADGSTYNTHQLLGVWKKVDEQSDLDTVQLMIVERRSLSNISEGSFHCLQEWENGGAYRLHRLGRYSNNLSTRQMHSVYTDLAGNRLNPDQGIDSEDIRYQFGGSCSSGITMTLTFLNRADASEPGGLKKERYEWYRKSGTCNAGG